MRTCALLTAVAVCVSSIAAGADTDTPSVRVGSNSLLKSVGAEKDQHIDIRGGWLAANKYESPRIPAHNATTISCGRASQECVESQAHFEAGRLSAFTIRYAIQSWSEEEVLAKRVNPRGVPINCTMRIAASKGIAQLECIEAEDNRYFRPAKQNYTITAKERYNVPGQWPVVPPKTGD